MQHRDWLQFALFLLSLFVATPFLGRYLVRVFEDQPHPLRRAFGWLETLVYRASGVRPESSMPWKQYLAAVLLFNFAGIGLLLFLQMAQGFLPWNPEGLPGVPFALALNTAVSFVTNTNWQAYSGETTMSYLTQFAGLTVQNFASAATGLACALALIRGLTRKSGDSLGNFWADLVRGTLYVLAPLSLILALVFLQQGVPQTTEASVTVQTLEGGEQTIPRGPVASQIAIKQLGTNGGGFFGTNAAHPFENPTPLTNFLQVAVIFWIPGALTWVFGSMAGDRRQGWVLFAVMLAMFLASVGGVLWAEAQPNPALGLERSLEGKEVRFGSMNSALFAVVTTAASCGAVNAMHDSFSPLGGGVLLLQMMFGEVIFGGVGAGLYGMLLFVLLTVFLAGLMVGRTPEYLGKKIEAAEIRWAVIAVLVPCATILSGVALACSFPSLGTATLGNQGPHGLSEVLYAFTSAAANNGSAFGGLGVNNDFYNYSLAFAMLVGRFLVIAPVLAIAGSMAGKRVSPPSPGTFPTTGATFACLLISVILIVGALTFFPILCLGPVVEHLLMLDGRTF